MAEIDFSKYKKVEEIVNDIKSVKIQGATNVAIATFEGIKLFIESYDRRIDDYGRFLEDLNKVGYQLAFARENEPLAKNGLKFVTRMLITRNPGLRDVDESKEKVTELCNEFLNSIENAKKKIIENSVQIMDDVDEVFTHCHSSTAVSIIKNQSKRVKNFKAVCTETRPLFQGRITAKKLCDNGVETTLIVDSAAESFIIDRGTHPIDVVFLGADEITMRGDAINKIGSWGIALASYFMSKPVYIVTPILKIEVETAYRPVEIEYRTSNEIWKEAPKGLKMVNPAFEIINKEFITGYITELGIIKPEDISKVIQQEFQWLF
jgi:ribose 1,5-bisphosphate isomerase